MKALYDYEAAQSTELSISENDILYVYGEDEDWILVRRQADDSRVGYVPGNYVEEVRLVLRLPPKSTDCLSTKGRR